MMHFSTNIFFMSPKNSHCNRKLLFSGRILTTFKDFLFRKFMFVTTSYIVISGPPWIILWLLVSFVNCLRMKFLFKFACTLSQNQQIPHLSIILMRTILWLCRHFQFINHPRLAITVNFCISSSISGTKLLHHVQP